MPTRPLVPSDLPFNSSNQTLADMILSFVQPFCSYGSSFKHIFHSLRLSVHTVLMLTISIQSSNPLNLLSLLSTWLFKLHGVSVCPTTSSTWPYVHPGVLSKLSFRLSRHSVHLIIPFTILIRWPDHSIYPIFLSTQSPYHITRPPGQDANVRLPAFWDRPVFLWRRSSDIGNVTTRFILQLSLSLLLENSCSFAGVFSGMMVRELLQFRVFLLRLCFEWSIRLE